jgi:hypothetical protein
MNLFYPLVGLTMIVGTPIYIHALFKLYHIVLGEHPEWLTQEGALSFFYTGMPKLANPNISLAVLAVAFGQRRQLLASPQALRYIKRIRILLPVLLVLFLSVLGMVLLNAP